MTDEQIAVSDKFVELEERIEKLELGNIVLIGLIKTLAESIETIAVITEKLIKKVIKDGEELL